MNKSSVSLFECSFYMLTCALNDIFTITFQNTPAVKMPAHQTGCTTGVNVTRPVSNR